MALSDPKITFMHDLPPERLVSCLRINLNNKYLLHRFKRVIEPAKIMEAISETQYYDNTLNEMDHDEDCHRRR